MVVEGGYGPALDQGVARRKKGARMFLRRKRRYSGQMAAHGDLTLSLQSPMRLIVSSKGRRAKQAAPKGRIGREE